MFSGRCFWIGLWFSIMGVPCSFLSLCFHFFFTFIYLFWLGSVLVAAYGIFRCVMRMLYLVPWLEIEPGPPVLGTRNLSHWTTREVTFPYVSTSVTGSGFILRWHASRPPGRCHTHRQQVFSRPGVNAGEEGCQGGKGHPSHTPVSCIHGEISFPEVALPTFLWAEGVLWPPSLNHKSGWKRKDLAFLASAFGGGRGEGVENCWPKHLLQLTRSLYFSPFYSVYRRHHLTTACPAREGTRRKLWQWLLTLPIEHGRVGFPTWLHERWSGPFKSPWGLPKAPPTVQAEE